MPRYKFDDCVDCRFRRRKDICAECDYGEQFEDQDAEELDFDKNSFRRAGKSLTTDDDEPKFNPDDFFEKMDAEDDNRDDSYDEE